MFKKKDPVPEPKKVVREPVPVEAVHDPPVPVEIEVVQPHHVEIFSDEVVSSAKKLMAGAVQTLTDAAEKRADDLTAHLTAYVHHRLGVFEPSVVAEYVQELRELIATRPS